MEFAAKYAQERKQFGKAIADFQGIQFQIARWPPKSRPPALCLQRRPHERSGVNFVKEAP